MVQCRPYLGKELAVTSVDDLPVIAEYVVRHLVVDCHWVALHDSVLAQFRVRGNCHTRDEPWYESHLLSHQLA
jgi:hypothetical protein